MPLMQSCLLFKLACPNCSWNTWIYTTFIGEWASGKHQTCICSLHESDVFVAAQVPSNWMCVHVSAHGSSCLHAVCYVTTTITLETAVV